MGVVTIYNYKIDFIEVKNNLYVHKQIEKRNGFTYIRMKKRPILKIG